MKEKILYSLGTLNIFSFEPKRLKGNHKSSKRKT